jgi:hypothetical protein
MAGGQARWPTADDGLVAGDRWASAVAGGWRRVGKRGGRRLAAGGQVRVVALFIFLFFKYLVM